MEVKRNLNFSKTELSQVNQLLNKAEATLALKLHLGTYNPGHNSLERYNLLIEIRITTTKTKFDI